MVARSASILFLGYSIYHLRFVGSKGMKPRNCDLSSRIRQFVYESKFHLAIMKRPIGQTNKVLFLLDGSEISFEGLTNAIAFCKRFNKSLTVLHAYNSDLAGYAKHVKLLLRKAQ